MVRNILSIYLLAAGVLTTYFAVYVHTKGKMNYMKYFSALCVCVSVYLFGYLLEINSNDMDQMIFWNQFQSLGITIISTLWLIVTLLYTKRIQIISLKTWVLVLLVPVITMVIRLTNPYHHLYYSSMTIQNGLPFPLLNLGKGVWYYIFGVYIYILQAFTALLYILEYKKSTEPGRVMIRKLIIASFIPYAGLMMILFRTFNYAIDYAAFLMPVSTVIILHATFKHDFLEINTLARDAIFENSREAMVLLDSHFRIRDYNKYAAELLPALCCDQKNRYVDDVLKDLNLVKLFRQKENIIFTISNGSHVNYYDVSTTVLKDSHGTEVGMLKSFIDVTEKEKLHQELVRMATHDSLSGLNNRDQFMLLAEKEFENAKRCNTVFSVLMIDIDSFKAVNDTMGHAAGDEVIREIGKLMRNTFRKSDISGRIGGEEFAVLLPGCSTYEAGMVAEKFRKKVEMTSFKELGESGRVTISVGVAAFFKEAGHFDDILKQADEALYHSKSRGKNQTTTKKNH